MRSVGQDTGKYLAPERHWPQEPSLLDPMNTG
jgi:hypothetical protein